MSSLRRTLAAAAVLAAVAACTSENALLPEHAAPRHDSGMVGPGNRTSDDATASTAGGAFTSDTTTAAPRSGMVGPEN